MTPKDSAYYRARAEQEREAASSADEHIAEIHLELARQYEVLAEVPELRPKLRMAG